MHAVVVIGARKNQDKEHVYFIDPKDASDLSCPDKRPIYILSYASFKSYISTLDGILASTENGPYIFNKNIYSMSLTSS